MTVEQSNGKRRGTQRSSVRGRALASTPIARKQAVGYIRVSSEEQIEGYSLAAQERAIRAYCEAQDWDLVRLYPDEGRSAWTDDLSKRPAFTQMIEEARSGSFDVLIVHKLDRFARNVLVALETLHALDREGIGFVSLSESMDFTSPMGKVTLAMLASFAEYYSANLSAETKKGKAERKRQGMYNGLIPFGMVKGDDGIPQPDWKNLPGLVMAFERAAAGHSDRAIAVALTDAGYRTTGNRGANPFTKDTVRPMLKNRFYLGELPLSDGGWMPGKHQPVITLELFDAAQRARARNARRPTQGGSQKRLPWSFSGVATCPCGASLKATGRKGSRRRCECSARSQGRACMAPSFFVEQAEQQIGLLLGTFTIPENQRRELVDWWIERRGAQKESAAERDRLAKRLERLSVLFLEGDIDEQEYRAQKTEINARLASVPPSSSTVSRRAGDRLASLLADLGIAWASATPEERNGIAKELFIDVVIEKGSVRAVKPRTEMLPFFECAVELMDPSITQGRKRRDSNPPLRDFEGYIEMDDIWQLSCTTRGDETQLAIARIARQMHESGCSLRQIARELGVSHETARRSLGERTAAAWDSSD